MNVPLSSIRETVWQMLLLVAFLPTIAQASESNDGSPIFKSTPHAQAMPTNTMTNIGNSIILVGRELTAIIAGSRLILKPRQIETQGGRAVGILYRRCAL